MANRTHAPTPAEQAVVRTTTRNARRLARLPKYPGEQNPPIVGGALRACSGELHAVTAPVSIPGVMTEGDLLYVEPCTRFDADGLYVLAVGELTFFRRLRLLLATAMVSIEGAPGDPVETVPLRTLDATIQIRGHVVGAWSQRRF